MNKIRYSHALFLSILVALVYPASSVCAYSAKDQEIITTTNSQKQTVSLIVPRRAIDPSQVAVLANLQDVQSVNVAQYYSPVRNIPSQNIIYLSFKPARTKIRATEFNLLKKQVDEAVAKLPDIQAYVITWTEPWGVLKDTVNEGMSINTAFSMGFDNYFNTQQVGCFPEKFDTFDVSSNRPYSEFGVRPTMMLAGTSFSNVKDLIDRGKLSDSSFPLGTGYFVRTTDGTRSGVRYQDFIKTVNTWNRPDGIAMSYVDNSSGKGSNYLMNKTDILFYLTGLTTVQQINTNKYMPGAVADHLTSFGGILTGPSSQMSSLRWLEAGVTGSYGTMMEPYAVEERFPVASILTQHYIRGETLLESYWKSVAKPDLGVFIGDPLARPYGTKIDIDAAGKLNITTSILNPNRQYSLWSADKIEGPFKLVQQGITVNNFTIKKLQYPATSTVYLLQEDKKISDPNAPIALTDDGWSEAHLDMKGDLVAWNVLNRSSSTIFVKNLKTGVTKRIDAPGDNINELRLDGNMLAYRANSCQSKTEVIRIVDITKGQITKTIFSYTFGYLRKILFDNNRVYWVNLRDGISMYDLTKDVTKLIVANDYVLRADIDGNNLVWYEYQPYPGLIKIMDLITSNQSQINLSYPLKDLRVKGKNLYWIYSDVGPRAVVSYDLVTHQTQNIFNVVDIKNASFEASDKWVVLKDDKTGQGSSGLYLYNTDSKKSQQVDLGNMVLSSLFRYLNFQYSVALNGDKLAWTTNSPLTGHDDVYIKSLTPDLVAHWDMNEGSGAVAYDSTLNGNYAKLLNGPVWTTGKDPGGLSFDGVDDYLKVEHSPVLELGKNNADFSIALWLNLKQGAAGVYRSLILKAVNSNQSTPVMGLLPTDNRLNFCIKTTDIQPNKCVGSNEAISLSTWTHVAFVKAGSNLQIYINGSLDASIPFVGGIVTSTSSLNIGKANVALDDIRIYNRALGLSDISSLIANAGGLTPVITRQPVSNSVEVGTKAIFSVLVSGSKPMTYQWKKNGVPLAGATATVYTTNALTMQDNGAKYSVVVKNSYGSTESNVAVLTVKEALPVIVTQPASQTFSKGQTANFTVVATTSTGTLTYQWKKNGALISGATTNTYSTVVSMQDNGVKYSVAVSNLSGTTNSIDAVVTVKSGLPVITTQPLSQFIIPGQSVTLNVVASGPAPLTYQWKKNGVNIPGATASTYHFVIGQTADTIARYRVQVSNSDGGVLSAEAVLTLQKGIDPSIVVQPADQSVSVGQKATFSVVVNGPGPMFYFWIKNQSSVVSSMNSYTTPVLTAGDNGAKFIVYILNSKGFVMSREAKLTVTASAPANSTAAKK